MATDWLGLPAQTSVRGNEVVRMVTGVLHDSLTDELQRSKIKLSDELLFSPQKYGEEYYFHIEVPSTSKFYRVSYTEYAFISSFNGEVSFAQALAITAQNHGAQAFSEQQGMQIIEWLLENGIASFVDSRALPDVTGTNAEPNWLKKCNPFWLKLPLGNPAKILTWFNENTQWVLHPVFLFATLLVILLGAVIGISNYSVMLTASTRVLSVDNWFALLVIWGVLKIGHELAHGLVCHRLGGNVREAGIIFILMAPMAYVDVTSSWRFSARWKRIAVAVAGMYFELLVAAICCLAWFNTSSPEIKQLLFTIITMAGLSTVLFNANPLMRFDGYFILSDLLRIPNLYQTGIQVVKQHMTWLFFGKASAASCLEIRQRAFSLAVYGYLATFWKVVVIVGLAISASVMFGGAGILLTAFGMISWFGSPMMKLFQEITRRRFAQSHSVLRMAMVSLTMVIFALLTWYVVPSPFAAQCACVVEYENNSKVRSEASGFVVDVLVEDGQRVSPGTPLIRMVNDELEAEIASLKSELAQHTARERIALSEHNTAEFQNATQERLAAAETLKQKQIEQGELLIRAHQAGRIVGLNLPQMRGKFFERGTVLLTIGSDHGKEIFISVPSEKVAKTEALLGKKVPVEIGTRRRFLATISHVDPKATRQIQSSKVTTLTGGDVTVQTVDASSDEKPEYELVMPHYRVIAQLAPSQAASMFAGERGHCRLQSKSKTLGQHLFHSLQDWLETQLDAVQNL